MTGETATGASVARSCDGCTLCCKLLRVEALAKPAGQWCSHCAVGAGCGIYATRPDECAAFRCRFLTDLSLDESWRPATCGMVIAVEPFANRIVIHVDRPDAWRKAPYEAQVRAWAAYCLERGGQLVVMRAGQGLAVFPRREKALGEVGPDRVLVTLTQRTPLGPRYDVLAMARDDPRLRGLAVATRKTD